MIKLLRSQNTADVADKFRAEKIQLKLTERDSTATITVGPEAPEIGVGRWLQDEDEPGAGIVWRVRSVQTDYKTGMRTIQCEHAISVLKEILLFGEITPAVITNNQNATVCTATEALAYIFAQQGVWQFGSILYNDTQEYNFNGDNVLAALETVSRSVPEAWWRYDFSRVPYTISITEKPGEYIGQLSELRMDRNIKSLNVTVDRGKMYTRFYPIGRNNLMLPEKYISKNESTYGIISKTETDENKTSEEDLRKWANERLRDHAEPQVTITVNALDLSEITGESLDSFTLGAYCTIPLPEYGTALKERIVSMQWQDKQNDPMNIQLTLANTREDLAKVLNKKESKSSTGKRSSAASLSKALKDVILTGPVENDYALIKVQTSGKEELIGTFSRAVAEWEVSAADGTITVTAKPQDQSKDVKLQAVNDSSWNGNVKGGKVQFSSDDGVNWANSGLTYSIDATARYNAGWGAARSSVLNKTYIVEEKTYNYFPSTAVAAADRLQYMQVAVPNATVNGGINDTNRYRYYVTSGQNDAYIRYGGVNGYVVAAVNHNQYSNGYSAGWGAARSSVSDKTYEVEEKTYDYFPASAVAAADRLNYIQVAKPNETVNGGINDTNRYRYYITSGQNDAYIRYGSLNGYIVAAVNHNQYSNGYNEGWGAARSSVSDKTYEVDNTTYDYFPASAVAAADRLNYIQVAKPNETVNGGINDTNRYRYYITSGQNDAYIRYGSLNGYIVAAVNHNQYSNGYNEGWGAARSSVSDKTYEVDNTTYDYFPASAVAAADRLNYIQVAKPNETVNGGINDTNRYRYYITSGQNDAYIRYGSINGYIVAAVNHNQYSNGYSAGWGAARGSVTGKTYEVDGTTYNYFPASAVAAADRLQYIQVAVPNETVDGGINDTNRYRYYITSGQNDAYIRYGSINGYIVAAVNHNQYSNGYSAGWGAARGSVTGKTYTDGGKTYNYFPASAVAAADRLNYIQVAVPNATVDGGINDTNRYKYYITSGQNDAYIRYGSINGYVVAAVNHNQYSTGHGDGWEAARNECVWPVAEDTNHDSITIYIPDVGSGHTSRTYYMGTKDTNHVGLYTMFEGSPVEVAELTHGTVPQASSIQLYKNGVGEITRSTSAPSGNPLTSLATILKQAYTNQGGAGQYVKFPATIDGGSGTKWYYIYMG